MTTFILPKQQNDIQLNSGKRDNLSNVQTSQTLPSERNFGDRTNVVPIRFLTWGRDSPVFRGSSGGITPVKS